LKSIPVFLFLIELGIPIYIKNIYLRKTFNVVLDEANTIYKEMSSGEFYRNVMANYGLKIHTGENI